VQSSAVLPQTAGWGVDFQMLIAPIEFVSEGKGWLAAARCVRVELGESDVSVRRPPVTMQVSEFDLPLSVAFIPICTSANMIVQSATPGLSTNKRGYIQAGEETQRTTRKRVFAGGDIGTGSATVIFAMGADRRAARSIHDFLSTGGGEELQSLKVAWLQGQDQAPLKP
jgi:glutamate synthase (NADPH) small chain